MAMRKSSSADGPVRRAIDAVVGGGRPGVALVRWFMRAPAVAALVWPMLLIVAVFVAHARWGRARIEREFRGLDVAAINVTPPPEFIRSPVVETVYRETGLSDLSLLEVDASAKIASAFAMHPWVESVQSVRKLPGGQVNVRLRYRDVAAMVKVFKPGRDEPYPYYFPVDREGVVLPPSDFSGRQTLEYIHIDAPGAYSSAAVGDVFGDSRVHHAATLAGMLADFRSVLDVKLIHVHGEDRPGGRCQLEIELRDGASFFWGSPPGLETPGEPTADEKLAELRLKASAG